MDWEELDSTTCLEGQALALCLQLPRESSSKVCPRTVWKGRNLRPRREEGGLAEATMQQQDRLPTPGASRTPAPPCWASPCSRPRGAFVQRPCPWGPAPQMQTQ